MSKLNCIETYPNTLDYQASITVLLVIIVIIEYLLPMYKISFVLILILLTDNTTVNDYCIKHIYIFGMPFSQPRQTHPNHI